MANPTPQTSINAFEKSKAAVAAVQSNVSDAVVAHSITDTATELDAANETELEGFFDALGVKINACLTALEWHGLMTGTSTDERGNMICADKYKPMLSTRLAAISDAVTSHSITDTNTDLSAANETELEGFYDALGTKINAVIDILGDHGLVIDTTNNPSKQDCLYADKNGNPLINKNPSTLVANAVVAHSITDVATDLDAANELELEGFFNALGTKINSALDVLEAHGLMADA